MKKELITILIFLVLSLSFPLTTAQQGCEEPGFIRGDSNNDCNLDISDTIHILNYLFTNGNEPHCNDAADANDDGRVDITDAIFSLNFMFLNGPIPPAPHPIPGHDPTEDENVCIEAAPIFFGGDFVYPFEQGVAPSLGVTNKLTGQYKSIEVTLRDEIGNTDTLIDIAFEDPDSFVFENNWLNVDVPIDILINGERYTISMTAVDIEGNTIFDSVNFVAKDVSNEEEGEPQFEPQFQKLVSDVPPVPPEQFCISRHLDIYKCTNDDGSPNNEEIKDKDGRGTGVKVSDLIESEFSLNVYDKDGNKEPREGKILKEIEKIADKIDGIGLKNLNMKKSCFVIAGVVEADTREEEGKIVSNIDKCKEGQEVQSTTMADSIAGIEYTCPLINVIRGMEVAVIGKLPGDYKVFDEKEGVYNKVSAHCFEEPDEAIYCPDHSEDPGENWGHSPNYAGDDYHKPVLFPITKFVYNGEEVQIKGKRKAHIKLSSNTGAENGGELHLVAWIDTPFSTSNWPAVKDNGKRVRNDLYHSYLQSSNCQTGNKLTSKHICFKIPFEYKKIDKDNPEKHKEGPWEKVECKLQG